MENLIYIIGLTILILLGWLVYNHGFWTVMVGLGTVAALILIITLTVHLMPKPVRGAFKKCMDACQLIYAQCGQECYLQSSGYQVKTCLDNCGQILAECLSVCEKEKAVK